MNAVTAFARHDTPVLFCRGEPIAYWAGEHLRFTQGVWHVLEAKQLLDALSLELGTGVLFTAGNVRRVSNATWYEVRP